MRDLAALEQDRSQPVVSPPVTRWGLRQRMLLAGAALAVVGVLLGSALYYIRPVRPDVADYEPWMALNLWLVLEQGIDRPPHPREIHFQQELHVYRQWMGVAAALAGLGVLTMAGALVVDRVVPRRRKPGGRR